MDKLVEKKYTVYSVLYTLASSFSFAVYTLFLRAHQLSFTESNLVNMVFFLFITLMEIPTGMIADWFGRKQAMFWAMIINGLGMLIYGLSSTILGFIIAEILVAIGRTFNSGSAIAWLKDNLDGFGSDRSLTRILASVGLKNSLVVIVGGFIGNMLFQNNIYLPWLIGGVLYLMSSIYVLLAMPETYHDPQILKSKTFFQQAQQAWQELKSNKSLILFLILKATFLFTVMATNMTWAPYVDEVVNQKQLVKWIWVLIVLTIMLGEWYTIRYTNQGNETKNLLIALMLTSLPMMLLPFIPKYGFLLILVLHELGRGISKHIWSGYPNHFLSANIRATALSLISMIVNLGGLLGLLISGYLSDHYGIAYSWLILGSILFIVTPLTLKLKASS